METLTNGSKLVMIFYLWSYEWKLYFDIIAFVMVVKCLASSAEILMENKIASTCETNRLLYVPITFTIYNILEMFWTNELSIEKNELYKDKVKLGQTTPLRILH